MKISVQPGDLWRLFGHETTYSMIGQAGFDGIDWNLDHAWSHREVKNGHLGYCVFEEDMDTIREHYARELSIIRENGLQILQAHAPFPCIVDGYPELSARVPKIYDNCIRFCGEVGIPYLVIHGISRSYDGSDMTRAEMIQKNINLYAPMIPAIKETGVMVLLENLFWDHDGKFYDATCSDPSEAAELLDMLNAMAGSECFGLCFDVGHCNLLRWDMTAYLKCLGSRIKALHLHDNDGKGDWHMLPCAGTVDWNKLCEALREIGYDGAVNFETFCYYDMRQAVPTAVPALLRYLADTGKAFAAAIRPA